MTRTAFLAVAALTVAGCGKPSVVPPPGSDLPDKFTYAAFSAMAGPGEAWHIERSGAATFTDHEGNMLVSRHFNVGDEGFRRISGLLGPSLLDNMQCALVGPDPSVGRVAWIKAGAEKTFSFVDNCVSGATKAEIDAIGRINAAAAMMRGWSVRGKIVKREKVDWPPK